MRQEGRRVEGVVEGRGEVPRALAGQGVGHLGGRRGGSVGLGRQARRAPSHGGVVPPRRAVRRPGARRGRRRLGRPFRGAGTVGRGGAPVAARAQGRGPPGAPRRRRRRRRSPLPAHPPRAVPAHLDRRRRRRVRHVAHHRGSPRRDPRRPPRPGDTDLPRRPTRGAPRTPRGLRPRRPPPAPHHRRRPTTDHPTTAPPPRPIAPAGASHDDDDRHRRRRPPPRPPGTSTRRRSGGADAKIIVRVDHTALLRGAVGPGELCEISGIGPIPVSVVRRLDHRRRLPRGDRHRRHRHPLRRPPRPQGHRPATHRPRNGSRPPAPSKAAPPRCAWRSTTATTGPGPNRPSSTHSTGSAPTTTPSRPATTTPSPPAPAHDRSSHQATPTTQAGRHPAQRGSGAPGRSSEPSGSTTGGREPPGPVDLPVQPPDVDRRTGSRGRGAARAAAVQPSLLDTG